MKWTLASIASGFYPKYQTLEQPWNSSSAQLFADTLAPYQPSQKESLTATAKAPLLPDRTLAWAQEVAKRASESKTELIVCYYVGHMLVNQGGCLALLQGGVDDESLSRGLLEKQWPATASFLPVADLHRALCSGGVPVLLIVDGCMESKAVSNTLASHGFHFDQARPGLILYDGPKEILGPDDFQGITGALANFGRSAPYLTSKDPLIFAAKPGTLAIGRTNPFYEGGPLVAPMAANLHRWSVRFLADQGELPPLKALVDQIAGWRGIGEIGMEGAISWSDFTGIDPITSRIKPGGYASQRDARDAVISRLAVPDGEIEDFCQDPLNGAIYCQVHRQESSGVNLWSIWRIPQTAGATSQQATNLLPTVVFPKIGFGDDCLYLQHDDNTLVRWPRDQQEGKVQEGEYNYVEFAAAYDGHSILALSADNIEDKGGDTILRYTNGKPVSIVTAELTQAHSLVEFLPNHFAWLDSSHDGTLQILDDPSHPEPRNLPLAGEELIGLIHVGPDLIALNRERTRLYRLSQNSHITAAPLLDAEDHPIAKPVHGYAGFRAFNNEVWLASGREILHIDLSKLDWQQIKRGP